MEEFDVNNPAQEVPPALSHVSLGTSQYQAAVGFYDKVLATLGIQRVFEESSVMACAYGRQFPEFWVQAPFDRQPPSVGNGSHVAFLALNTESVDAFYKAAIQAGATDDGEPGARPQYSDAYYGCFVRDLDGHKIEAMFWDASKAPAAEES